MEKDIKVTEPGIMKLMEDSSLIYYRKLTKEKLKQVIEEHLVWLEDQKLIAGLDNDGNIIYFEE